MNMLFVALIFFYFQVSDVSSTTNDTISSTNQPLSGSWTLISIGDVFEFGLLNQDPDPDPGHYRFAYIGIWYKQVIPRTIVWVANREPGVRMEVFNCFVKILNGNLIFYDNSTDEII